MDRHIVNFLGLTVAECRNLSNFYHFRDPVLENNKNALLSIDQSLRFLDSIEFDLPKGTTCHYLQHVLYFSVVCVFQVAGPFNLKEVVEW